jgi:hypothetical protein
VTSSIPKLSILIGRIGEFTLQTMSDIVPFGLGILLMGVLLAQQFGRFSGGNSPTR